LATITIRPATVHPNRGVRRGSPIDQPISTDVSENVDASLRRAAGLYRGLVEKLPGVTYLWGPAGRCTYVSPQVVAVFGCSEQAFGEGAWRDAIAEEDLEGVIDHVRNQHAADRGAHVEYRIHHLATGEERWLTEQTTLVTVEGETLVQGLILDITTQVQAAKVLEDSENERRRLVGSLLRAAEAERVSLATELHDDTVQVLAGALLTLDRIRTDLGEADPTILGRIQRLRLLLAQAMERTRTLMFDINPQLLHASGLTAATRSLAAQLATEGGFQATVEGEFGRLPGEFESLAYRIVREAVINANKHAQCRRLDVHLRTGGGYLEGTISDDGIGFSPEQALSRGDAGLHFGLRSAIERARIVDGTLAIISAPGQGTTIRLRLPIAETGD
jgi:PAS domain S-box-containing protein